MCASSCGWKISGLVLLDLSAAFDLVEPSMLCEKLRIYGMDNDFLEWIASYLIGRQQAVWISHVRSKFKESYLGVPQVVTWGLYSLQSSLMI